MSFINELKRRNVFKVGIAYAVAAWLVLQLTEVLTELLEIGPEVGKIVIVLLLVGFIPALIFAWAFEMTPEGIKRDADVDRSQSVTRDTGRKLDFAIIAMLVAIAGYFIWESRFMDRTESAQNQSSVASSNTPQPQAPPTPPGTNPSGSEAGLTETLQSNAIAVLPFVNRSAQQEDAFFSDGIHDDLLTQLAKLSGLKVVSRTSMMRYRDTEKSIPEIAAELQVGTILEGGVQRAGQRIRINAQLIDVANDEHLWAETFDREMTVENIFDIQSEITRQIVQAVRGELTSEEQIKLSRIPTANLEAYEAYLRAVTAVNRPDYAAKNFIDAERWLDQALALDPQFAQAWALMVEIHGQAIWMGYDATPERAARSAAALEKARQFGPDLPEVLAAEAEYTYRVEQNFSKARDLYQQVHEALPGDPDMLYKLAIAKRRTPDVEGALISFLEVLEIDPSFARAAAAQSETLEFMSDFDRLTRYLDLWIPRFPEAYDLLAWRVLAHLGKGEFETAKSLMLSLDEYTSAAHSILMLELAFWVGEPTLAIELLSRPVVKEWSKNRGYIANDDLYLAWAHRLNGDEKLAEVFLDNAIVRMESLNPVGTNTDAFEAVFLAQAYALKGNSAKAIELADQGMQILTIESDQFFGTQVRQLAAVALAMAGERERALELIELLLNTEYRWNKWKLYKDPRWDFFRDDERFNALILPDEIKTNTSGGPGASGILVSSQRAMTSAEPEATGSAQ